MDMKINVNLNVKDINGLYRIEAPWRVSNLEFLHEERIPELPVE